MTVPLHLSREELEHLKKKLEWKDNQITELVEETMALKKQQQQQQQQHQQQHHQQHVGMPLTLPRLVDKYTYASESPDSLKEMEKVYQQIDKYVHLRLLHYL